MEKVQNCEVLTLAQLTEIEFLKLYDELHVSDAPEKRKADIIDSFWNDIYNIVFRPGINDIRFNNCKSRLLTYNVHDVEDVCNMFIKLNKRYGGVIKFNQFSNLTGINRYTLYLWHKANNTNGYIFNLSKSDMDLEYNNIYIINNGNNNVNYIYYNGNGKDSGSDELSTLRFDVIKKLQEEMQDSNTNGLSNDTMGQALRANNEDELGKLYEPRRMVQREQIRQTLTAADIRRELNALNCAKLTDDSSNNNNSEHDLSIDNLDTIQKPSI